MKLKSIKTICAASIVALATAASAADAITVVNYGGAVGNAQKKAWVDPYKKTTGAEVLAAEYTGDLAKVKAMVETKQVTWDAVEVQSSDVGRGCDDGLFEKIDWNNIGKKSDFIPEAVTPCGVGSFVWSTVLAYNADRVKGTPNGWKDFWNVKQFPGKRGMRKEARSNLEFALMADGVEPKDVYPVLATKVGVERAFKKMDEIRSHVQWWEAGAQPPQFLAAGDVVMSTAYNGRIDVAQRDGNKSLRVSWAQSIFDLDYWVIPKGSKNKTAVEKFIAYASSAAPQAEFAKLIAYGPVNVGAPAKLDAATLTGLPNSQQNRQSAIQQSLQFWTDHGEELEQRFTAWASK
ncbi:MAG: ABC transporter substrate-binding protein [Burkholderiaceae bacterium]